MTRDEELDELRRKLEVSRDRSGLADRVKMIEARIAELEASE